MKITENTLVTLIKEEVKKILSESFDQDGLREILRAFLAGTALNGVIERYETLMRGSPKGSEIYNELYGRLYLLKSLKNSLTKSMQSLDSNEIIMILEKFLEKSATMPKEYAHQVVVQEVTSLIREIEQNM